MSEELNLNELLKEAKEITREYILENRPQIFLKPTEDNPNVSFEFTVGQTEKVKAVEKDTRHGKMNMIVLDTFKPIIICSEHAYLQLTNFIKTNKIKIGDKLKYVTRKGESYETVYIFEKA